MKGLKPEHRQYTIKHVPGQHLNLYERIILARDWNAAIEANSASLTIRSFAKAHGLAPQTWQRELNRGAEGKIVRHLKNSNRWVYPRYNPFHAQESVDKGNANKGTPMRVTNLFAQRFAQLVTGEKRSPNDALEIIKAENPGKPHPCLRTLYYHIDRGDIGVLYGQTPNHPNRRKKKSVKAHPAQTVPGRNQISQRPAEANDRSEINHFEMDTIVSGVGGKGGLLILGDRKSRIGLIEKLEHINQESVAKALRRMKRDGRLDGAKSVTTDNGSEFLDQALLEKILGCKVYYTRAYASYEKGTVENINRLVRRWYPKGTDFSCLTREDALKLERTINSIHRQSLGGLDAATYHMRQLIAS